MRAVAEEAGLSVGLAYHYFDSKDDLFARTLDRIAAGLAPADGTAPGGAGAVLESLWAGMESRPAFPRLLAWYVLTGRDVTSAMSGHPMIAQVGVLAEAGGHPDPVTLAEVTAALGLAGVFFGPGINRAAGRDPADRALYDTMAAMFAEETTRRA